MGVHNEFKRELLNGINGVSYIGKPKNNTMMYMSKKIASKIIHLANRENCLVFLEDGIDIPVDIQVKNKFVLCNDPAAAYTDIAVQLSKNIEEASKKRNIRITDEGFYIGENVIIGANVHIEPGVFIDHDVIIGAESTLMSGAKVRRNTRIGKDCYIGENTVIGDIAFNVTNLNGEENVVIPSFGGVLIGDNVSIGANTTVCRGSASDTVIENNVKIAGNVRIAHDVHLNKNVELMGSCSIGGYCEVGYGSSVAINASLKNRIKVGDNCFIGMGSVVIRNVNDNTTVCGCPAKNIDRI